MYKERKENLGQRQILAHLYTMDECVATACAYKLRTLGSRWIVVTHEGVKRKSPTELHNFFISFRPARELAVLAPMTFCIYRLE